jgi:phosphorylcholine metabolism protein LicD
MTQKEILFETIDILNSLNLKYWIAGGTLLGIVREGIFLSNDTDIDIGIFFSQSGAIDSHIITKFQEKNYELYKHNIMECYSFYKESTWNIDLWTLVKENENYWHYGWSGKFIFPNECLDSLDIIKWEGREIYVPHNPEKYLECLYGINWKTPQQMKKPNDYSNYKGLDNANG